jgi:hypothetical protein
MPKIDENRLCHFFDQECFYPISEEEAKIALAEAEEGEIISAIPPIYDSQCTNCLLAELITRLNERDSF